MAENKKSGKFFTSILIGGALGSIIAWVFGSKNRRQVLSEKTQQMGEKVEEIVSSYQHEKKGWFSRLFKRK